MIKHWIHFFEKGFFYTWGIELPFRLNQGDQIHHELFSFQGLMRNKETESDEWAEFTADNEHLEVEYIAIDHNAEIEAWLTLPKPLK